MKRQDLDLDEVDYLNSSLYTRRAVLRHVLLLESALDAHTAEYLRKQRFQNPDMFAVGFGTDESPPSQSRFGGFRFQVTNLYAPL